MPKTAQIKCINKRDRYDPSQSITHVGGYTDGPWKITQDAAIRYIEGGEWQFYVSVQGHSVRVVVATSQFGNKYLKTVADGEHPNNLLSLPECP